MVVDGRRAGDSRIAQLDSLRGLAAMSVLIEHCFFALRDIGQLPAVVTWFAYTPLVIFFSSYQAVLLFFVLSGFVLAIPFYAATKPAYRAFVIKRVLRIYPALWAVLLIAVVLQSIKPHPSTPSSWWLNGPQGPIRLGEVVQHFILVGSPSKSAYDPVIWSLVHEMRISLVLPLIALGMAKGFGRRLVLYGLPIAAVGFHFGLGTENLFGTVFYAYLFLLGAYLAYHRKAISSWIGSQSPVRLLVFAAVGVLLYLARSPLPEHVLPWRVFDNVCPWLAASGAAIFIMLAIGAPAAGRVLRLAPLHFLGKISYSLYLVHAVILYALMYWWQPGMAPAFIPTLVLTPAMSVLIAWLIYVFVERPGIKLGSRLASIFARTNPTGVEPTRPAEAA